MTDGGSSIAEVQALLSVLATGRRAAEAGTAFGEGSRAIARSALSLVTVELDPERASIARAALGDLPNVELVEGDWREELPPRGPFGFLFLDSTFKRDPAREGSLAVELLSPGGLLVLDDMTPGFEGHDPVREWLARNERLVAVEIRTTASTAAIIAARR